MSQFPIRPHQFRYVDCVAEDTIVVRGGVSDTALAEIAAIQPYNATDGFRNSKLWWLHRLDAIDKHRHLLLHAAAVFGVRYFGAFYKPSGIITPMRPLKRGEVVMVLTFATADEEPKTDMEPMIFVVLGDVGQKPLEGIQVAGLMADLYVEVELIIDRFRPMFKIDPVGRGPDFVSDYLMRLDLHREV